ncbi:hypothetical protein BJ165DRAFT_1459013 [Panaeolus papilionaceus]|nr:hypothetical protein BJ165DRAFT_1609471 [Panaeolus papilionaceus]KAF9050611.1 hypothetical protein BJ165DRAFT_1459013 [Panaeolus papilionaceus]
MKFTTTTAILTTLIASAHAWEFTGWDGQNYTGEKLIYRSGGITTNNLCVDIIINDNRMSSFQFVSGGCDMKLFDGHGCAGTVLGSSTSSWNVAAISSVHNNKASSLWIDCI